MARVIKRSATALIDAVRFGVAAGEGPALRAVHTQVFENLDREGTRLTVLADRARMTHQAMGELVTELIELGYLQRVPDPVDGRARLIRTTALGDATLTRAAQQLRQLYERWQRELGGQNTDHVIEALNVLIRICEQPRD